MGTALIQLQALGRQECSTWSTISGSAVTQIVIVSNLAATEPEARALYNALLSATWGMGAHREQPMCDGSFEPGPDRCWAARHPGAVRRVLVWVGDGTPAHPPAFSTPYHVTLALLPRGASVASLPAGIAKAMVCWYQPGHAADAVPDVLVASGLGLDAFRVFISYRHDDCAALAEQLFDALSHEQFDVYLDRFRTVPGTNFLERIRFELADKACVLLLDSKDVGQSPWVRGEYAFARKYRLGLMAVDLPGGRKTFHRIATRIGLQSSAGSVFTKTTQLDPQEIDKAAKFVRSRYSTEMARRPRYQRRLIQQAASLEGAPCQLRPDGNFDVGRSRTQYVVAATARPPALETLRPVCQIAGGSRTKGILVGPRISSSHSASMDVAWLAATTGSAVVDERRIRKAMALMAQGSL